MNADDRRAKPGKEMKMKSVVAVLALAGLCVAAWAADNALVGTTPIAIHQSPVAARQALDAITVPQMLSYQGKLTDTLGIPVSDTTYQVTFRLYTVPTGGASFWNETQTVRTRGGLFSTLVGSAAQIESVPSSGNLYLGMAVAGGAELSPRLRLVGSAYSLLAGRSANSDLLQGRDTSTFSRSTHNHDATYVNEAQANSITGSMLVDATVKTADVGDTAVTMAKLAKAGATTGEVIKWTGSVWEPGPDNTGGGSGVTNVYQDTGITCVPNPITTTGNVKLNLTYSDARYVNEAQANSVTGAMITDGQVSSADIRDTTVNTAELKDGAVTSAKILDATITAADIRDTTVNTADMKDAAVTAPKLNAMGATTNQVLKWTGSAWAPRNDSVGSGGTGTVTSISQATGVVCTPNPITTTGTVRFDSTWGNARYAPASGSANYIQNQAASNQAASWRVAGTGRCSTATSGSAALRGINTSATGHGVRGDGTTYPGVAGVNSSTAWAAVEGTNLAASSGGYGVAGYGNAAVGVYGTSNSSSGVSGSSTSFYGVSGSSTNNAGVGGSSSANYCAGVAGTTTVTGSGQGTGVGGYSPTYWGVQGWRSSNQKGSGYGQGETRGGTWGMTSWGDTWTFGTAGYTGGDTRRTGGAFGADVGASTWGSLGYKNSAGNWYAGYGTAGWTSGSGLSSHQGSGIGCGYGGGLMGGWLKGRYYGATVSGDRYALYAKGNSYTSGYSAVMQNTGSKREAAFVATSTNVDIYTSGVAEMKGGQVSVAFPASFASMVSKDVPVVVTATPMGPAPIYLSSSDRNGFVIAAVDGKASIKFSWIAVGRRAGYETNPEVPAELCRTDFDSKMDGVMSDENDLEHSAQPVWFDGTRLRFDAPPEPVRPHKLAPSELARQNPPVEPTRSVPSSLSGAEK